MPPSLHPHLKRGLDFGDFHLDPEDRIEEPPAEYEDAEHRAAKRRRIEAIASRYLRGRPPVIITAGLRGPFNNGWKSPWTKPVVEQRRTLGKSNNVAGTRNVHSKKVAVGRRDTARRRSSTGMRRTNGGVVVEDGAPQTESPETSRAATDDLDHHEHDDSLDQIEVPPATAPLPDDDDDDDVSGATEFSSVNTAKCIQNPSPMTNPFWLRRPESTRVDMRKATNGNTDTSPTRSRSRSRNSASQTQTLAELRLSLPKAPIRAQTPAPEVAGAEEWRSSASASMLISSCAKGADIDVEVQAAQISSKPSETSTPTVATPHSTEPGQRSQRTVPIITSSMGSQENPTRNDVLESAGRFVDPRTASNSREQPRRPSRQSTQNALSPVPASSTGIAHKKTKQRPRAVNFDSSPDKAPLAKELRAQETAAHNEAEAGLQEDSTEEDAVNVQTCQQAEGDGTVVRDENPDVGTSRSSRDSDWSTQAAMTRAQLEFQQSTFPVVSPEVLRMDSQPSPGTPSRILAVPSAAITPLSAFTVQRDEPLAPETVLQAPPISTQDLFGAASPFAFSTVKKKSEGAQRSNLRFALSPSDGVLKADAVAKSPTPTAERIPLKDKNNTTCFWSFITHKASQGCQGSSGDRWKGVVNEVGLAALDIDMSLGDFGPIGDVDFTDGFLRNMDDT